MLKTRAGHRASSIRCNMREEKCPGITWSEEIIRRKRQRMLSTITVMRIMFCSDRSVQKNIQTIEVHKT